MQPFNQGKEARLVGGGGGDRGTRYCEVPREVARVSWLADELGVPKTSSTDTQHARQQISFNNNDYLYQEEEKNVTNHGEE